MEATPALNNLFHSLQPILSEIALLSVGLEYVLGLFEWEEGISLVRKSLDQCWKAMCRKNLMSKVQECPYVFLYLLNFNKTRIF